MSSQRKIWRGGISIGARACDGCGAPADVVFQIGHGCWVCRSCVLDPVRQIGAIDRRGDVLHGARIARELDAQTAITLHLEAKDRAARPGIDYGPPLELLPLPAAYQHVLAALDRCRRVDAEFETVLSELRERYAQAAFFSPKQMLLIQWRLSANGITHDPGCFAVSTRSDIEIAQMHGFDDWRRKKLAPYLSWAQRGRFGF